MDKKPLIVVSLCAVVLLVLGSLSNVVGYQSVKSRGMLESLPKMQIGPGYVNWTVNGTMGENGWYISPITLTCIYDHEVIAHVYYEYVGSGYTEYTEPFTIPNQGFVTLTYYAVDYEGEIEDVSILPFRIDYTPPYIDLSVEKTGFSKWLFSAIAEDSISGVVNVAFYLDGQFLGNVTAAPYEYVWTGSGNHSVCAIAYDAVGLNASSTMSTPYTFQSSNQQIINERINQRELLFQTIVDIANNKEIQRIILKSQLNREGFFNPDGRFPAFDTPVLTKNQLKQMYVIGLVLSKVISRTRIQSMIQQNQLINPEMQKDISAVIEKDSLLRGEITQLKNSECDCENENTEQRTFPIICTIFLILIIALGMVCEFFSMLNGLLHYILQISLLTPLVIVVFLMMVPLLVLLLFFNCIPYF